MCLLYAAQSNFSHCSVVYSHQDQCNECCIWLVKYTRPSVAACHGCLAQTPTRNVCLRAAVNNRVWCYTIHAGKASRNILHLCGPAHPMEPSMIAIATMCATSSAMPDMVMSTLLHNVRCISDKRYTCHQFWLGTCKDVGDTLSACTPIHHTCS